MTQFVDWSCKTCGAFIPANVAHGKPECSNPQPFLPEPFVTTTPDPRDEQISALQAQVERLTAERDDSNAKLQALEIGIRNLLESHLKVEQQRDTFKRENAAFMKLIFTIVDISILLDPHPGMKRISKELEAFDTAHPGLLKREALDGAIKEQG